MLTNIAAPGGESGTDRRAALAIGDAVCLTFTETEENRPAVPIFRPLPV